MKASAFEQIVHRIDALQRDCSFHLDEAQRHNEEAEESLIAASEVRELIAQYEAIVAAATRSL